MSPRASPLLWLTCLASTWPISHQVTNLSAAHCTVLCGDVPMQLQAEPNRRRHTLGSETFDSDVPSSLPFSSAPRRLAGALRGGAGRVPTRGVSHSAWGNGDSDTLGSASIQGQHPTVDAAAHDQRTALQREFQAVQRARAMEQANTRARLAELYM